MTRGILLVYCIPPAVEMRRERGGLVLFPVQLFCSPEHFNKNNNLRRSRSVSRTVTRCGEGRPWSLENTDILQALRGLGKELFWPKIKLISLKPARVPMA